MEQVSSKLLWLAENCWQVKVNNEQKELVVINKKGESGYFWYDYETDKKDYKNLEEAINKAYDVFGE